MTATPPPQEWLSSLSSDSSGLSTLYSLVVVAGSSSSTSIGIVVVASGSSIGSHSSCSNTATVALKSLFRLLWSVYVMYVNC